MVKIFLIIIIAIVLIILGIGLALTLFVTNGKRPTLAETEEIERSKNVWGDYDTMPKEELNVTSFDGYLLHGVLLKNESDRYVIITHGWQYNRNGSIKYANLFYKLGFNVYIYDLRYFGENKHTYCSMGRNESKDIIAIKEELYKRFGKDIKIGLHGESLGCASSILALGLSQDFEFCVADCGYADLKTLLFDLITVAFHLPKFMVYVADFWSVILHHYSFFSICPRKALEKNRVPILFIHGGADDFIDSKHSHLNYEADAGKKRLVIFKTAKHADAYFNDPERYAKVVGEFIEEMGLS